MSRTQQKKQRRKATVKKETKSLKAKLLSVWKGGGWLRKATIVLLSLLMIWTAISYGVARWYMSTQDHKPLKYGVTFIPGYARHFDLDPQETMQAMIDELGIRQFRLVSYWNIGEPTRDSYNFEELDWQFKLAEESGSKVSLAIGLRQPRWPECHMPTWAEKLPMSEWSVELKDYMKAVIERYKDSPALESYQLENEFFMKVFGICPDHTRERLVDEYNFVKSLDSEHPVIVSRSNNWIGVPLYPPIPDTSAVSVYKRVWEKDITKRYFEYPLPAWFYAWLGGAGKIVNGTDLVIHELQAESWLPPEFEMNNVDHIPEMEKSLNAERLRGRFEYGRDTGIREIYVWGAEWWYWQKEKAGKSDLWEVAKEEFARTRQENEQLQY